MVLQYALLSLMMVVGNSAHGMMKKSVKSVQKVETDEEREKREVKEYEEAIARGLILFESYKKDPNPLGRNEQLYQNERGMVRGPLLGLLDKKQMYQEAYEYRNKGDMKTYEQMLQQAAQPVTYTSHNGPKSELRTTSYFKAEYDWARLLEKKGNMPQALIFYGKSLSHSRYSTENKAKEFYVNSFGRVQEIWTESKKIGAENKDALVLLARECFRGDKVESIEQAFKHLECIEAEIPQEERFALFKKYGWRSVVAAMDLLNVKQFAHRDGLALFHLAQLKQFGVCCDQNTTLASRYYINALKKAQPNDTYKVAAEQNLHHLAFAKERTIGSASEYMHYVKSQKQWETYYAIGTFILDDCQVTLDLIDKEIEKQPGCRILYHAGDDALNIDYFETHYPELFVASELDDEISEELRFKLTMLEIRYLVLKAKEFRVNQNKDPYTDVLPAYRAAVDGYKELATVFKKRYTDYNVKEQHSDYCLVAAAYALELPTKTSNLHLQKMAIASASRFHSAAAQTKYPAGLYFSALFDLGYEVTLSQQKARSSLNIMEHNAPLIPKKDQSYFALYQFYSGKAKPRSFVDVRNVDKAKEYVKKSADEGSIDGMFAYGSLLLKGKDATKHAEGRSFIEKAAQEGSQEAIAWVEAKKAQEAAALKLQEIYDDIIRPDSDGKASLGNLRTFIKELDKKILARLEKDALFNKVRAALTEKNKVLGNVVTASLQQRLNEIKKVDEAEPKMKVLFVGK